MTTGDQGDFASRLVAVLPRWFGDITQAPVVMAVLQGAASTLSGVYALIVYAALQCRIKTASDGWLDMIAGDFFGPGFWRRAGQSDAGFRAWIIANLFRERGTRNGLIKVLTDITGRTPMLVEFNRPTDTGAYGGPMLGYGAAGAYGTLSPMPMQAMVTAFRPQSVGASPLGFIPTDAEIAAAVDSVRPATYTIWVRVSN